MELYFILVITALSCNLPGIWLVLRKLALLSDAIGHVLLFGIVIAYLITHDAQSIWLKIGAALAALFLVILVEQVQRNRTVKQDAAIGLTFPALFSIGIILSTAYLRDLHLDVDRILFGIPELLTLRRVKINRFDIGSVASLTMSSLLLLNLLMMILFYKEFKLSTFDETMAYQFGYKPRLLHYLLMTLVSFTAVGAFDTVGPILVVGFMIIPAATAHLFAKSLGKMFLLSSLLAGIAAILGTFLAQKLDTNIAGMTSIILGCQFALAILFRPKSGLIANFIRRIQQKHQLHEWMLLVHLAHHKNTEDEILENRAKDLKLHLSWPDRQIQKTIRTLIQKNWITETDGLLRTTAAGDHEITNILR